MKSALRLIAAALVFNCATWNALAQEAGIKVSTMLHDDGTRTVTTIDPGRRASEAVTYSDNNKMVKKIVYVLDETNLPVSGVLYDNKGKAIRKITYKYDALRRVSEEETYTTDNRYLGRFVYEYAKDRLSKIRGYDAEGTEVNSSGAPVKKDAAKAK